MSTAVSDRWRSSSAATLITGRRRTSRVPERPGAAGAALCRAPPPRRSATPSCRTRVVLAKLHSGAGRRRHRACQEAASQIADIGERDAADIEGEEVMDGQLGAARRLDRGGERLWDEEATERAQRRYEADHRCRLATRGQQRLLLCCLVASFDALQVQSPEEGRDHPERGAVADAGGGEQHQEREQELRELVLRD